MTFSDPVIRTAWSMADAMAWKTLSSTSIQRSFRWTSLFPESAHAETLASRHPIFPQEHSPVFATFRCAKLLAPPNTLSPQTRAMLTVSPHST